VRGLHFSRFLMFWLMEMNSCGSWQINQYHPDTRDSQYRNWKKLQYWRQSTPRHKSKFQRCLTFTVNGVGTNVRIWLCIIFNNTKFRYPRTHYFNYFYKVNFLFLISTIVKPVTDNFLLGPKCLKVNLRTCITSTMNVQ